MYMKYVGYGALLGLTLLVGASYFDDGFLPAMRERFMPESVLYSGNLNTAIWDRGDWARFALQGKKFRGPVYGCRWSLPLAVVQWTYAETANESERGTARNKAAEVWKSYVAEGKCVEAGAQWYTVEDIRTTPGMFLQSFSPGQRRTVPGMAKIHIDGSRYRLFIGVNIPLAEGI